MIAALVPDGLQAAFTKFCRAYIVDECPDEKMERTRRERIDGILDRGHAPATTRAVERGSLAQAEDLTG